MFNIGPLELVVLAIVGLIVLGPDRLPGFARDVANVLRTLRDIATGARQQLQDELGDDFAELQQLRNLNPRTAVQRAVFGDEVDLGHLNPRNALRDAIFGDDLASDVRAADPRRVLTEADYEAGPAAAADAVSMVKTGVAPDVKPVSRPDVGRPRPRPRPATHYDDDAT